MTITTRRTSLGILALFFLAQLALLLLYHLRLNPYTVRLSEATGYLINPNLLFALPILGITVGVILLGLARLRPAEIGLEASKLRAALAVLVGLWLASQAVHLAAAGAAGTLAPHPFWEEFGPGPMLGFLVAMLFGIVILEEVSFRGFLFPQLALRLGSGRTALLGATVLTAIVFALLHLPTRLLGSGLSGGALVMDQVVLTLAGIFGVAMYLRTANLPVVIAIHTLVNAPMMLVASPISPGTVTVVLSLGLLVAWPWFRGEPVGLQLARVVSAGGGSGGEKEGDRWTHSQENERHEREGGIPGER